MGRFGAFAGGKFVATSLCTVIARRFITQSLDSGFAANAK